MKVEKKVRTIDNALLLDSVLGEFLNLHLDTDIMFDLSDCKIHLEKILKSFRDTQSKVDDKVITELGVKELYNRAIRKVNNRQAENAQPVTIEEQEVINKVNDAIKNELELLRNKKVEIFIPIMTKEIIKEQSEKYNKEKYGEKAFIPTIKNIAMLQRVMKEEEESPVKQNEETK